MFPLTSFFAHVIFRVVRNRDHLCELLTPIDPAQALDLVRDPRYLMQLKEDGFRLVIDTTAGQRVGFDRKNQITAIPPEALARLQGLTDDSMFDGELVDGRFVAWDVLRWMGQDVCHLPYSERLALLQSEDVEVVRTWEDETKAAALIEMHDAGAEGVCFKDSLAIWQPGRAGQHYKLKFWESATCRVADKSLRADRREDKHSIALELLGAGGWQEMGFVTIPNSERLPAVGSLVEVRYLYAQADGLYQPVFIGSRNDIDAEECALRQLKWKADRSSYAAST
jgi:bifunctional non-homologous end joining protein LigD